MGRGRGREREREFFDVASRFIKGICEIREVVCASATNEGIRKIRGFTVPFVSVKRLSVFPMANPAFALELRHMMFKFFVLCVPYEVKQKTQKEIRIAHYPSSIFGCF